MVAHQDVDVEAVQMHGPIEGTHARNAATEDEDDREPRCTSLIMPALPWLYIFCALFAVVEFALTLSGVAHLNQPVYDQYGNYVGQNSDFSNFNSVKLLLATSIIGIVALVFIYSSQPVSSRPANDFSCASWSRKIPYGLFNSFVHILVWILWFSGGIDEAVWLNPNRHCVDSPLAGNQCAFLLPSSLAVHRAITIFAFFSVIVWTVPTISALERSYDDFKLRGGAARRGN